MRHPESVAIDKWFESEDGKRCCDDSLAPRGEFLRNRLRRAFSAGWDAAKEEGKLKGEADGSE